MLDVNLATSTFVCDREDDLAVRLTNAGTGICAKIILRLALPGALLRVGGSDTLELARLPAGATATHTLRIRPRQPGQWMITSPNFSYRDAYGQTYRVENLAMLVDVRRAALMPPTEATRKGGAGLPPMEAALLRQTINSNQRVLHEHRRRLQIRQAQLARYGIAADPSILLDIEDIQERMAALEAENAQLRARLGD